ncbi:MAG: aminotransferase class IV [Akkermansiaceae bacterium]
MSKVIINGVLVDEVEAKVSLLDRNVQLGLNVFETMTAVDGEVDGFELHMVRLRRGMDRLKVEVDGVELLEGFVREVVEANSLMGVGTRARVRITVMDGVCMVQAEEAQVRAEVCSVVVSEYVRNERSVVAGVKCGSYAENILALREAQLAGADEVVFLNTRDEVAETATANIFIVKDGVVVTPGLESGCLPGVTRELVIQRARSAGLRVVEGVIYLEELLDADEVFLTNASIGVQAVDRIGGLEVSFCLGEVTEAVRRIKDKG